MHTTGDILLEANGIILTGLTNNVSMSLYSNPKCSRSFTRTNFSLSFPVYSCDQNHTSNIIIIMGESLSAFKHSPYVHFSCPTFYDLFESIKSSFRIHFGDFITFYHLAMYLWHAHNFLKGLSSSSKFF